ncbi:hypothetical protein B0H10DRAFT_1950272 [Mycena sp. CBHHK59/15]|nr:hypothetical protein B0H10DRAFT_1950272 [Mycena sp. CBHHK59/15]
MRCLRAAEPSSRLWARVGIWCSTDIMLLSISSVLSAFSTPILHHFLIASPFYSGNRRSCASLYLSPPPFFGANLPALRTLRLVSAAVVWGDAAYFGLVGQLEISDLQYLGWPTAAQMVSTFSVAVHIRHLVLGGGGVIVTPSTNISPFIMPALESMTVVYSPGTRWFIDVLIAGSFPRLREFSTHHFNCAGWSYILQMDLFSALSSLTIVGNIGTDASHLPLLFGRLISVTELDLIEADDAYVVGLMDDREFCPSLRVVKVDDPYLLALANYAVSSATRSPGNCVSGFSCQTKAKTRGWWVGSKIERVKAEDKAHLSHTLLLYSVWEWAAMEIRRADSRAHSHIKARLKHPFYGLVDVKHSSFLQCQSHMSHTVTTYDLAPALGAFEPIYSFWCLRPGPAPTLG